MSATASSPALASTPGPGEAANEAAIPAAPDSGAAATPVAGHDNVVSRTVGELVALMGDVHHLRENLKARGVPLGSITAMVENGVRDGLDALDDAIRTASASARNELGGAGASEQELRDALDKLVTVEKDLRHARQLAGRQGLNMQAINQLTLMIRQNPGDGGVNAMNNLVAYASSCGLDLSRVQGIIDEHAEEQSSVLPVIERDKLVPKNAGKKRLLLDLVMGLALSVVALWLVR